MVSIVYLTHSLYVGCDMKLKRNLPDAPIYHVTEVRNRDSIGLKACRSTRAHGTTWPDGRQATRSRKPVAVAVGRSARLAPARPEAEACECLISCLRVWCMSSPWFSGSAVLGWSRPSCSLPSGGPASLPSASPCFTRSKLDLGSRADILYLMNIRPDIPYMMPVRLHVNPGELPRGRCGMCHPSVIPCVEVEPEYQQVLATFAKVL